MEPGNQQQQQQTPKLFWEFANSCYHIQKARVLSLKEVPPPPPSGPPSISLNRMAPPIFAHLVVQVQSLEVAIEHEALHVAVQGEICVTAKSVDSYVMPVLVIEDSPSAHGCVTRPWLDGAAA